MSAVEDRIVAMKFDNKQFEQPAKQTMSTLDRLKAALSFKGSSKGLTDLQNSANRFSLKGLVQGASEVGGKFSTMSVAAIAAIANIASRAVDAGITIVKAFTLDPLKQGFQEYETQLNAVQTILANTQASGSTLSDVNAALNQLNTYADKTIYNFSEMARNIGTFTAAGVDLDKSVSAIKGIANLAALSGSNSQQASTAMYQLSQAISAGRVGLQDWNSVVNAGMGGAVFQRALAMNAEKMGTLNKGAVKFHGNMKNVTIDGKSFRESITAKPGEKSWLTSDVLTRTLSQFTGDLSDAQLAAQGFNKEEIKAIQAQAKTAQQAATQVKTFTALMDTLKEAAGSGWAQSFSIVLGDFEESRKLWTDISNVVGGALNNSSKARNKMLQDWKNLGGRTALLKGLENIFHALVQVVKPIHDAFREIFPATTGKQLYAMTIAFLNFTKNLKIGSTTMNNIKRTAAGFFAALDIGWQIVKGILGVIGRLFNLISSGSGSFLSATANIGDFLVNLDKTIKKGDLVNKFFDGIGKVLAVPIALIKAFGIAIAEMFRGIKANGLKGLQDALGRITQRLKPLFDATGIVSKAWQGLISVLQRAGDILKPIINVVAKVFSGITDAIAASFQGGNFNSVFDALNTGLLTGIVLLIKKFIKNGLNIDFGGGIVSTIKDTFETLTKSLQAMQTQIQAKTLMLIAGAIAILTASIVALSLIDSAKLTKAMGGIAAAFTQLLLAMSILTKIAGSAGFVKVPLIAGSMVLLATSVLILTAAVSKLSKLDWGSLTKGLIGVAAILGMIVLTSKGLDKSSGGILRAGLAMIPMSVGLLIMSKAVASFGSMSWEQIGKGLTTLAASLLIIAGAVALMPPTMIAQAAGLVVLSLALIGIGMALKNMGGMKWGEIAKAMTVLAGSLILLAAGMIVMTEGLPGAAAMLVAAAALVVLAPALKMFSELSWQDIGKAMTVLAGSMIILAVGLTAMTGAVVGAAALTIAAAALAVLAPVLLVLGAMSWGAIGKGLVALAGAFAVLGAAGLLLTPLIPAILALSAALLILGAGVALVGAGLLGIATAFSIFAAAGTAGIAVLLGMINLIPQFMTKFAQGIIGFATTIAAQAGKFVGAFKALLIALLDAVIQVAPKIGQAIQVLLTTILNLIVRNAPRIANAGMNLMIAFMTAIRGRIGQIVNLAADIIVRFLRAMSSRIPGIARVGTDLIIKLMNAVSSQQGRLLNAGATMIIRFINNLASTIRGRSGELGAAGGNLARAIVSGMASALYAGASSVIGAAVSMARSALAAAKAALGIHSPSREFYKVGAWSIEGMANALSKESSVTDRAAASVGESALAALKDAMSRSDQIKSSLDVSPTIRPVLDLSLVHQGAGQISDLLANNKAIGDLSLRQASSIDQSSQNGSPSASITTSSPTYVELKQYNTSPKALSTAEIYRDTKSLLRIAKEALPK